MILRHIEAFAQIESQLPAESSHFLYLTKKVQTKQSSKKKGQAWFDHIGTRTSRKQTLNWSLSAPWLGRKDPDKQLQTDDTRLHFMAPWTVDKNYQRSKG